MDGFLQIETELSHRFAQHLFALNSNVTPAEASILWLDITARYDESQRAYHSLRHIEQLFVEFEKIASYLYEPHIIALALYYHDVIYNPIRSDNELKSAEHMLNMLKGYLSDEQCQWIYALIMMTATHQLTKLADHNKRSDATYLLDMDLSMLGAPWSDYERYAKTIRQEYAHVPIADYQSGRTKVLQTLLSHAQLYLTEHYHKQLEAQARANIKREIILLAS